MQSGCWAAWERAGPAITGNAGAIRRIAGKPALTLVRLVTLLPARLGSP